MIHSITHPFSLSSSISLLLLFPFPLILNISSFLFWIVGKLLPFLFIIYWRIIFYFYFLYFNIYIYMSKRTFYISLEFFFSEFTPTLLYNEIYHFSTLLNSLDISCTFLFHLYRSNVMDLNIQPFS